MSQSSRLLTLLKIEEAKERKVAKEFSTQRRILADRMAKLTELEGYLREYNQRFSALSTAGTSVGTLRSSHAFICKLNSGISQQQRVVSESKCGLIESRHRWLEAKRRVNILQKVIDKMVDKEKQKERDMEQSISDEAVRYKYSQT